MEFELLFLIQNYLRNVFLDSFFLGLSKIAGDLGQFWVILAVASICSKKTRKCGFSVLLTYLLIFVFGQYVLKDYLMRPRPCHLNETVDMIVKCSSSYSCPSTHTAWAFGGATAIFLHDKRFGILTYVFAALIGFSRMYLFVHFPTDVLFGALLGIVLAILAVKFTGFVFKKLKI